MPGVVPLTSRGAIRILVRLAQQPFANEVKMGLSKVWVVLTGVVALAGTVPPPATAGRKTAPVRVVQVQAAGGCNCVGRGGLCPCALGQPCARCAAAVPPGPDGP